VFKLNTNSNLVINFLVIKILITNIFINQFRLWSTN